MDKLGQRGITIIILMVMVMAVPEGAFANSAGKTGSSSTGCAGCHGGTNTVTPTLTTGIPSDGYTPGTVYSLSIGGSGGVSGTKGGFNLDSSSGTFSNPGTNAWIVNGEVTHSNSNSRTWTVDWTAPSSGTGGVTFLLAINFVNGNSAPSGDSWGTNSWTVSEATSNPTNWTLNQPGSDRGSVFSHSILYLGSGSPTLVLDNGTTVSFASGTGGGYPQYTEGDVVSVAGDCSMLSNLSLYCSGDNSYGQLGLGSNSLSSGIVDFGSKSAVAISDGNYHNCAILDDGSVRCWGRNNLGQLGDGTNLNRNSPVQVNLGHNRTAVSVSAGVDFTCALLDNGNISCWGDNSFGILADGSTNHSNSPVTVNHSAGNRPVSISSSGKSVCAIMENGSVRCWGKTYTVFVSGGLVTNGSIPISLPSGRTAVDIDGTAWHTCAILDNASVNCWGVNTHGQWGDGTCSSVISGSGCAGNDSNTPVYAQIGGSAIAIAAGTDSTCAFLSDYSLQCWGAQSGEFDGSTDDLLLPHTMNFSQGASIAFSEQDFDGDGIWNSLDTHMAGDDDGDGVPSPNDPYPNNPARWQNCPEGQWGRLSCSDSPSGHYSFEGDLYYSNCIIGTYQPDSGQGQCYPASSGNIVTTDAASDQSQCSPGTYQPQIGQSSCIPASPGNYSNLISGDAADSGTPAILSTRSALYFGSILSQSDTADMYSIEIPRDHGLAVSLNSSSGIDVNLVFTYLNLSVIDNSSSNPASVAEYASTNNTGFPADSMLLIWVNQGNATSVGDYEMTLWVFSTLTGNQIGNSTYPISAEIGISQYQCSPGTYQPNQGGRECNSASAGHFVFVSGAQSQQQCYPGTYQPSTGQTQCLSATPGNYVSGHGASTQTPASPGHYVNTSGATDEIPCVAGTFQSSSGQISCDDADPGHYVANSGQSSQIQCSPGNYQPNYGQTSCIDADPGHYVSGSAATNQTQCSAGTYQPSSGQSSCTYASTGHYVSNTGSTTQSPCYPGSYQPSTGQTLCLAASPGHYVASSGSSTQTPCPPGSLQAVSGQNSCEPAMPGHYVDSEGSTSETPCPEGTYNPDFGATSLSACSPADPGHYVQSNGSAIQTPCFPGSWQNQSGQTSCILASLGHWVTGYGSTEQAQCPIGTFQNETGKAWCLGATPGFYVDSPGSYDQTPCPAGKFNPSYGSNSSDDCLDTNPGHFTADPGSSSETECSSGTFQPNSGQSYCIDADTGHYVPGTGATGQVECGLGHYQDMMGSDSCIEATPGHYVDATGSVSQSQCPPTTYNPSAGSDSLGDCIDADPGYYSSDWGTPEQLECPPGTYQPNSAQSLCLDAGPGHFAPYPGSTSQFACAPGTYNPSEGSSSVSECIPADPGYYTDKQASATQTACTPGTYQMDSGQQSCIDASPGYFVSSEGQSEQTPAPLDSYVNGSASTGVETCPDDHITLQEGSISSEQCFLDSDGDRIRDISDSDDDGDGVDDGIDLCPLGLMGWMSSLESDFDGDGCNDIEEDSDDDNDGFPDDSDALPLNQGEWADNDMDGIGDNSDTDDDNDALSDLDEDVAGTDPYDSDTDDDGFQDGVDAFPKDPTEWADSDGDGYGDNGDAFPNDPAKHLEEDFIAKYGLVLGLAAVMLVVGLGGWMAMRRKGETETTPASEQTHDVELPTQPVSEKTPEIAPAPQLEPEMDTSQFLEELESDLQRPNPPPDAKMNEHGQLVWIDDSGTVYAQNQDGSVLTFDVASGTWVPLD